MVGGLKRFTGGNGRRRNCITGGIGGVGSPLLGPREGGAEEGGGGAEEGGGGAKEGGVDEGRGGAGVLWPGGGGERTGGGGKEDGGREDGGGGVSGGGGLGGDWLLSCDPPRAGAGGATRAGFGDARCFPGGVIFPPPEVGGAGAGLVKVGGDDPGGGLVTVVGGAGAGLLGAGFPGTAGDDDRTCLVGRGKLLLEDILGMGFGGGGLGEGGAASAPSKLRACSLTLDGSTGVGEWVSPTPLLTPLTTALSPLDGP